MSRVLLVACFVSLNALASPCSGINRTLTPARKAELAPIVASQLNINSAEILQSYEFRGWHIIYVETFVSDEAFLFFPADPTRSKYLAAWGGGAAANEGPEIKRWVLKNAKGIPTKLASCFAWHVTKDRDQ